MAGILLLSQEENDKKNRENEMKKTIIAVVVAVLAVAMAAQAADGKKKKKQRGQAPTEQKAEPVRLLSEADSMSYAAGVNFTRGLMPYLNKQLGVDTAYIDAFVEGYRESVDSMASPRYRARVAGMQVASQVETQFVPRMEKQAGAAVGSINPVLAHEGFVAAVQGDTTLMAEAAAEKYLRETVARKKAAAGDANKAAGERFLAENKDKEGVVVMPSGLQYKVIEQGTGPVPTASDMVTVRYEGHLIDGTEFDSSYKRKPDTSTFKVSSLIKGWVEALQLMPVGSKWELYIPYQLAYGDRDTGIIAPYSALVFIMELVGIQDKTQATE